MNIHKNKYDLTVLGGGVAGYASALHAAEMGASVCLIEQGMIGWSSINRHYVLEIARNYLKYKNAQSIAVPAHEEFIDHLETTIKALSVKWETELTSKGVHLKSGSGVLVNDTEIMIHKEGQEEVVAASKVIIATGSTSTPMPSFPYDGEYIVSDDDALKPRKVTKNVLVLGGSVHACETAIMLAELGAKVILCHEGKRILENHDPDIIQALESSLKQHKVKLIAGKKPVSIYKNAGEIEVTLEGEIRFSTDRIIQSIARIANTGMIKYRSGIQLGDKGQILVNEKMETAIKGVYAAGSVTGGDADPLLAEFEGKVAVKNALGKNKTIDRNHIPMIIRTNPEIVSVGCTLENASYKGFRGVAGVCDYKSLDHALIGHASEGLIKVVADKTSKKVIGVHIVGAGALEMVSLATLAVKKGLSVSDLATITCAWPSKSQGIKRAARNCLDLLADMQRIG